MNQQEKPPIQEESRLQKLEMPEKINQQEKTQLFQEPGLERRKRINLKTEMEITFWGQLVALTSKEYLIFKRNKCMFVIYLIFLPALAILPREGAALNWFFCLILLSFLIGRSTISNSLTDRENNFRATFKLMGLKDSAYYLSILIFQVGTGTILSTYFLAFCWLGDNGSYNLLANWTYFGFAFVATIFFHLANVMMCYAISLLFRDIAASRVISNLILILILLFVAGDLINSFRIDDNKANDSVFQHIVSAVVSCFPSSTLANIYVKNINQYDGSGPYWLALPIFMAQTVGYFGLSLFMTTFFSRQSGVTKDLFGCLKKTKGGTESQVKKKQNLYQEVETEKGGGDTGAANLLLKNIVKKFGDFTAVKGISCKIFSNMITCILGHNGAGKTTLINCVTGINPPTSGEVFLNGVDVYSNPNILTGKVGYCTAQDVLYDFMTVSEFLTFICLLKGVTNVQDHLKKVMEKCDLVPHAGSFIKMLSGGTRRRTSIASAVIGSPKIIVMDEPSSGVDPENRRQLWDLIDSLKSKDSVFILTTHHLEEAEYLSQDVIIMDRGQIEIRGSPLEITQKFGIGYRINLSGLKSKEQMNQIFGSITTATGVADLDKDSLGGSMDIKKDDGSQSIKFDHTLFEINGTASAIIPLSKKKSMPKIIRALEEHTEIVYSLESNTLEEAFVNLGEDQETKDPKKTKEDLHFREQRYQKLMEKSYKTAYFRIFIALLYRRFALLFSSLTQIFMFIYLMVVPAIVNWFFTPTLSVINIYIYAQILIGIYNLTCSFFAHLPFDERRSRIRYILKMIGVDSLTYYINMMITDIIFLSFLICLSYGFLLLIYTGNYDFDDRDLSVSELMSILGIILLWGVTFIAQCKRLSLNLEQK